MRRIVIGDIQGCRAPLEALLARVGAAAGDQILCVGDLVNRGPDSAGTLRLLRRLGARPVLGNHDLHALRLALRHASPPPALRDLFGAPDREALLGWLAAQPVMRVFDDLVVVHAGLHPHWHDLAATAARVNAGVRAYLEGADDPDITFATQVRHCDADGNRPARDDPPPGPPFRPWDSWYRGRRRVAFGHWARRGLVLGPRVRGLDTGCVYGGALTAWIVETDRIVQVPGWTPSAAPAPPHQGTTS